MKDISLLFDFPQYQLEKFNLEKAFSTKYGDTWVSLSSQEYIDEINKISRGLLKLGVKANDKIALISTTNRTEWNIMDMGILQLGAQTIPIYPTISKEDYQYVLNHSEATFCFVSDAGIIEKLNQIKDDTHLKAIYTFDEIKGELNWKDILKLGENTDSQEEVEAIKKTVKPDDLATIIYTSGTTGKPKGVMLSHRNLVSNALDSTPRLPLVHGTAKALSFLPVCHVFERIIHYIYLYCGIEIHFAQSQETISDNIKEVQPDMMTAVPRLYEKIYDAIVEKGANLTGIKKALFFWALNLGLRYEPYKVNGWWYETQLKLARKLIFSKWKDALGGRMSILVSGSAPLQSRLIRVFSAAGMPILEGYGLTETSLVIAVNSPINYGTRIGTVGRIIDNVVVKIAEDGEILAKGPNIMLGYYKDPEKTASVMTGDFFHTGDIGELSEDNFLKITDRKKEMFKTSGGKYVAPALLENELKQSRFIEQIMVVGESEKMPAAIIQPNFTFIKEWIKRKEITCGSEPKDICSNERIIKRIQKEVDKCNTNFGKWEQIKTFKLTPEEWTIESGHLTPTLKMKRKVIKQIHSELYEALYNRS